MQNVTIFFVQTLIARIQASGCSIAAALEIELQAIPDRKSLLRLREAAFDLQRIVDLEIGRREPPDYCYCEFKGWRFGAHDPLCHNSACVDCGARGEHHCPAACDEIGCEECDGRTASR